MTLKYDGFTLVEMMIVIAIISILFTISLLPYWYYIERANLEKTSDMIGQEWILGHKDIRNGKTWTGTQNANEVFVFKRWTHSVERYTLSGSANPSNIYSTDAKKEPNIDLDSWIQILSFSGAGVNESDAFLWYIIRAPYGKWEFFTGNYIPYSSSGVFLILGYTGATPDSNRQKRIYLRPYFE